MLVEALAAKEEGNRLFRAGELHSAIIAYSRINNQNQRINNRSHLNLPGDLVPTELMDDFIRSPMWMGVTWISRIGISNFPDAAPLFKLLGQWPRIDDEDPSSGIPGILAHDDHVGKAAQIYRYLAHSSPDRNTAGCLRPFLHMGPTSSYLPVNLSIPQASCTITGLHVTSGWATCGLC